MEKKKDLCGFVMQKELTLVGKGYSALMLQITTGTRILG